MPELAQKYNINRDSLSYQLPTIIMFEDGLEVQRFPTFNEKT